MIERIEDWFRKAVPEPNQNNISVQLGCHFEEIGEMLEALKIDKPVTDLIYQVADQLKKKTFDIDFSKIDRKELLDSICDQIVTGVGVGYMMGMKVDDALLEVNASNWSKFDEDGKPIFNADGKIMKSDSYFKPDLTNLY